MSEYIRGAGQGGSRNGAANLEDLPGEGSAISWAAILAGAAGAAALSLLLLILGTGLGFSVVSPWSMEGVGVGALGFAAIIWLTVTHFAASGLGGYLAGRLRTKWVSVQSDEVFFRDTAHGFMTWAVSSLLMVVVTATVVGSIVSGGVQAAAEIADGAGSAATEFAGDSSSDENTATIEYFVDYLFRGSATTGTTQQNAEASAIPIGEVMRIVTRALRTGSLPQGDERYIAQLMAERTDLSQREAEQRVSDGFEEVRMALDEAETAAREAADEARKASAYGALWMFVALSIGAFAASLMAVFGGRQRDA